MNAENSGRERTSRGVYLATIIMAVLILIPSLVGFAGKLIEFTHVFQGRADGVFAITPLLNYLLASLGFLSLLLWTTTQGMFRDIEAPKHRFLENERRLDGATPTDIDSVLRGQRNHA